MEVLFNLFEYLLFLFLHDLHINNGVVLGELHYIIFVLECDTIVEHYLLKLTLLDLIVCDEFLEYLFLHF